MNHLNRARVGLGVLALGLALSGCTAAGAGSSTPSAEESPLAPYSAVYGAATSQEELDAQNARVQEKAAACMKEQGFEYTPDTASTPMVSSESLGMEWGSDEFVQKYGYGISTDPFGDLQGDHGEYVDPNTDYLESLSEAEAAAYNEALWGIPADPGAAEGGEVTESESTEPLAYDWTKAGCMGAAQHEVDGGQHVWDDPEFADLLEGMNATTTEAQSSPELDGPNEDWSACMAEAGLGGFTAKLDAPNAVTERYGEITGSDAQFESNGITISGQADDVDTAVLAEVQAWEIEVATADLRCATETGYQEVADRVEREIEQRFVDEHRAELDAMLAKYGSR
ncbi:hypothetical protein N1031_16210 [Herbiconiux moechotypicola]|uniref:Uncharacterized protein n=1 Tax=Herbiconiux moechotypicola TaxID=637393 RepID=A0ABP5QWS4_9MICO|nr:hypothetical protein [Herbiconiux moechotypicola]MCS5731309.1 hypothetical protein [Herbiconiux moechotypicola]